MMIKLLVAPLFFCAGALCVQGQPPTGPGEQVHTVVEEGAAFPGGENALHEYIVNSLKVPDEVAVNGIEGTVYVSVIVNKNGKVSDPAILKSLSPACDAAVLGMVAGMPAFVPAKQSGKPVRYRLILPVKIFRPVLRLHTAGLPPTEQPMAHKKAATVTVDKPPYFIGSEAALHTLIGAHIKTPASVSPDRAGRVYVSFIVGKDGSTRNFSVENNRFGADVTDEALRVAKLLTGWRPALHKGQPIEYKVVLPIWFPYSY